MIKRNWSTPILISKTDPNLCFDLAQELMTEYRFNSQDNIFDLDNEKLLEFKETVIIPSFNEFLDNTLGKTIVDWQSHRLNGWVASYGSDTSLEYHNHRGSQLSAVFYLLCEEDSSGGQITFTDPRQNANRAYDPSFLSWFEPLKIMPKTGGIVIFPSFLYHSVSTYRSNIRVALPVDLFLHVNS